MTSFDFTKSSFIKRVHIKDLCLAIRFKYFYMSQNNDLVLQVIKNIIVLVPLYLITQISQIKKKNPSVPNYQKQSYSTLNQQG